MRTLGKIADEMEGFNYTLPWTCMNLSSLGKKKERLLVVRKI